MLSNRAGSSSKTTRSTFAISTFSNQCPISFSLSLTDERSRPQIKAQVTDLNTLICAIRLSVVDFLLSQRQAEAYRTLLSEPSHLKPRELHLCSLESPPSELQSQLAVLRSSTPGISGSSKPGVDLIRPQQSRHKLADPVLRKNSAQAGKHVNRIAQVRKFISCDRRESRINSGSADRVGYQLLRQCVFTVRSCQYIHANRHRVF